MIRTFVRMFLVMILSLPFVACFANEDFEDLPNEPGRWSEVHLDSPNFNFSAQLVSRQELSMFQKNLQAIIDILHAAPCLNPLQGFDVQARIRQLTKINNEMGSAAGDIFVKGINAAKKTLVDLSPQEKKAKAWVNGSAPPDETGLGEPDDQVSRPLVYVNPGYFIQSLARTEPQLIVIYLDMENNSFSDDCSENKEISIDERGICKVMQQLDLTAIQKLIR